MWGCKPDRHPVVVLTHDPRLSRTPGYSFTPPIRGMGWRDSARHHRREDPHNSKGAVWTDENSFWVLHLPLAWQRSLRPVANQAHGRKPPTLPLSFVRSSGTLCWQPYRD